MAATLTKRQTDKARELIKTSMLVQRLGDHVEGKCELTPSQVRSAEILLNRTLPCLMSQTFSTDDDGAGLPILTIIKNARTGDKAA